MHMLPQLPNDFHEFINLNITYTAYYKLAGFIRPLQKQHVWSSTSHNSLYHSTFIPLRWLSVAACVRFKSLMLPYRAATCTATTYFKSIIQVYEPSRSLQFVKAATAKHETSITNSFYVLPFASCITKFNSVTKSLYVFKESLEVPFWKYLYVTHCVHLLGWWHLCLLEHVTQALILKDFSLIYCGFICTSFSTKSSSKWIHLNVSAF